MPSLYKISDAYEYIPTASSFEEISKKFLDGNPIHTDREFARNNGLEDVIMPGMQMYILADIATKARSWNNQHRILINTQMKNSGVIYPEEILTIECEKNNLHSKNCQVYQIDYKTTIKNKETEEIKATFIFSYATHEHYIKCIAPKVPNKPENSQALTTLYPTHINDILDACKIGLDTLPDWMIINECINPWHFRDNAAIPYIAGFLWKNADKSLENKKIMYKGFRAKHYPISTSKHLQNSTIYCSAGKQRIKKSHNGTIVISPITLSLDDEVVAELKSTIVIQ